MSHVFQLSTAALAFALCATASLQAGPREDAQARAALELSLALRQKPTPTTVAPPSVAVGKRPDYATAYYVAMKSGKPLMIHVGGFDCFDACKECQITGHCLTCDAADVFGDKTPRMILAKPSGDKLLMVREWKTAPTPAMIKGAIETACDAASFAAGR